jgi:EAL domain-containing protein (putative c-di-GMP-specific phosphodiesterase class I)
MIDMARALDLEVVAEGVERESQADVLRGLGCFAAQGYLFGRPAPINA